MQKNAMAAGVYVVLAFWFMKYEVNYVHAAKHTEMKEAALLFLPSDMGNHVGMFSFHYLSMLNGSTLLSSFIITHITVSAPISLILKYWSFSKTI